MSDKECAEPEDLFQARWAAIDAIEAIEATVRESNARISVVEILSTGAVVVFDEAFVSPDPTKVFGYSVIQGRFRLFTREILRGNLTPCLDQKTKSEALSLYYAWKHTEEGRWYQAKAELLGRTEREQKGSVLKAHRIEYVEHITHVDNVTGIVSGGIRARNSLQHAFTDIADESVNARRDRIEPIYHKSIHDYVPLYFNAVNPMLSRRRDTIDDLVIIRVSAEAIICSDKRWLISDGNAASHDTSFFDAVEGLERLDWICLRAQYWSDIPGGKRTRCAEMLVSDSVPIDWIIGIDCFRQRTMGRAATLAQGLKHVMVAVRENPFLGRDGIGRA